MHLFDCPKIHYIMWATGDQNQEDDAVELIQITQLTKVARTIVVCSESHRNDGICMFKTSRGRDAAEQG